MIILDTNVISEMMLLKPSPVVMDWAKIFHPQLLYTTVINFAEIEKGILTLPAGKRRDALAQQSRKMWDEKMRGRVLGLCQASSIVYAKLMAQQKITGRAKPIHDTQIAAIAQARGMKIATRNLADFEGCGVELINPWESQAPIEYH